MSQILPIWLLPEKFRQSTEGTINVLHEAEVTFFENNTVKTNMGKYAGDHDNKEDPNDRYEKSQLY